MLGTIIAKKSNNSLYVSFSLPSSPPCWQQLAPFIKLPRSSSPPTSGLVLLGVSSLTSKVVRTACEKFGSLNAMRGDFMQSRGLAFVSFLDERSAKKAASGLKQELGRCNSERVRFSVSAAQAAFSNTRRTQSNLLPVVTGLPRLLLHTPSLLGQAGRELDPLGEPP